MAKIRNSKAYIEQAQSYGVAYILVEAGEQHRIISQSIRQQSIRMGVAVDVAVADIVCNNQIETVIRITAETTGVHYKTRNHVQVTLAAGVSYVPVTDEDDLTALAKTIHSQADRMLVELNVNQACAVFNHKLERVMRIQHNIQEEDYDLADV